jgi:hypothetical protein
MLTHINTKVCFLMMYYGTSTPAANGHFPPFVSYPAPVKWRAFNWQLAIHQALGASA